MIDMTNNNWVNTWLRSTYVLQDDDLLNAGDIEELCRLITYDLLTKKDQEHKAELESIVERLNEACVQATMKAIEEDRKLVLESIKGEILKQLPEYSDVNYSIAIQSSISILDTHINRLGMPE